MKIKLARFGVVLFNSTVSLAAMEFEDPVQLTAGGSAIQSYRPGCVSPSLADLDGDGKDELLVGELVNGRIKVYQHLDGHKFAGGKWLEAEGKAAMIPGVW